MNNKNLTLRDLVVVKSGKNQKPLIRLKTFNQTIKDAKNMPELLPLVGHLWKRNEIAILAGGTGFGKSILASNIAISLAQGKTFISPLKNEAGTLKVLYFDFELSEKQFEDRFKTSQYPDALLRADIDPDCTDCNLTMDQIKESIISTKADAVILDNLSAFSMVSGQDADIAIKIMGELKQIQRETGVSMMVLTHVPKIPDGIPVSINHVVGSKQLSNFADSVFFIAKSSMHKDIRYLKQVKCRNAESVEEVYVLKILIKNDELTFDYLGMSDEQEHISEQFKSYTERDNKIMKYRNDGFSSRKIAEVLTAEGFPIGKTKVAEIIKSCPSVDIPLGITDSGQESAEEKK